MNTFTHTCHSSELCRCTGAGGHNLPVPTRRSAARGGVDPYELTCRPRQADLPMTGPVVAGMSRSQLRERAKLQAYIKANRL